MKNLLFVGTEEGTSATSHLTPFQHSISSAMISSKVENPDCSSDGPSSMNGPGRRLVSTRLSPDPSSLDDEASSQVATAQIPLPANLTHRQPSVSPQCGR
jgi:hypothetical protein